MTEKKKDKKRARGGREKISPSFASSGLKHTFLFCLLQIHTRESRWALRDAGLDADLYLVQPPLEAPGSYFRYLTELMAALLTTLAQIAINPVESANTRDRDHKKADDDDRKG